MNSKKISYFINCMINALLTEVISWPTPGLVNALDNGTHQDMNIFTFVRSAICLQPFFKRAAHLGKLAKEKNMNIIKLAIQLQQLGLKAEAAMYQETMKTNTHKGALFLGVLLSASVGMNFYCKTITMKKICQTASKIGKPIIMQHLNEIQNQKKELTAGLNAYLNYGIKGIRGEILSNFASILTIGIPMLHKNLQQEACLRKAASQLLLQFMTHIDDTTVLNRKFDIRRIRYVKKTARKVLNAGGVYSFEGMKLLNKLKELYKKRSISPGGSADLVAMTLCLYFWQYGYPNEF